MDRETHGMILVPIALALILAFSLTPEDTSQSPDPTRHINIYEGSGSERNWKPETMNRTLQQTSDRNGLIIEVTRQPDERPENNELEKAWRLYNTSYETAKRKGWFNKSQGLSDGYINWDWDPQHYPHKNHIVENGSLNPEEPEFLMYYDKPESNQTVLAGIMYLKSSPNREGSQIGGPITMWHYHLYSPPYCWDGWEPLSRAEDKEDGWQCPKGTSKLKKSPEMLHVWFIDHPQSQFSTNMGVSRDLIENGTEKVSKEEFLEKQNKTY